MMAGLECQRSQFDLPDEITYLNSAYMGPLSRAVIEAGCTGLARKSQPWGIQPKDFFESAEKARELFADLVSGDVEGVAMVPSVSYGIAIAAANLEPRRGENILVLEEQFPSNVYAWRQLAQRTGALVSTVEKPADGDWTRDVLATISDKTAIVAVPHCHWTDGSLLDLVRIGARARQVNAALVVDGCQSIGALPFDCSTILPDFLVTASYKWLLGPYSHGFLWVAAKHRTGRPIEQNWMARANAHDFAGLVNYTDEFAPGARRFDVGEVANFALLPAVIAALRQTLEWGVENIQVMLGQMTGSVAEGAKKLGLGVAPAHLRSGHLVGLRLDGHDPRRVAQILADANVFVSVRGDSVRVAPHVYNDHRDVERLLEALRTALS